MKDNSLFKQSAALLLSFVLIFSVFPMAMNAEENEPDLFINFEETYYDSENSAYYGDKAENWSANINYRGSKAEMVTEENGNKAVRLTYDNENKNENYNANAVLNIYNPSTRSKFIGTVGQTYTVSFDYKVENTDNKELQLFVVPTSRENGYPMATAFEGTDMGTKAVIINNGETPFTAATEVITDNTDGWIHTSVKYTAQSPVSGHTVYPIILLQTNGKQTASDSKENYASVLIDNIKVTLPTQANRPDLSINFSETYYDSENSAYYGDKAENWSANINYRGSKTEMVTEENGNKAVRLTYDNENKNENYNANAVLNIYNPSTRSKFIGTVGQTYTVSFDYKVENTDNKELQLFVVPTNRENGYPMATAFEGTDMGTKAVIINNGETPFTAATEVITDNTDGWIHTSVKYTAQSPVSGHTVYPIILLQTNGKQTASDSKENYASVLIDNIKVTALKQVNIIVHNYDGNDKTLSVYNDIQFTDLDVPIRSGYKFEGWYADSEYSIKVDDNELVCSYEEVYAKWSVDGTSLEPYDISNSFKANLKKVDSCELSGISYTQNSMLTLAGSISVEDFYGSYVFSSDREVIDTGEVLKIDGISGNPVSNTVMFYVELPDYKKSGAEWGLALGSRGICIYNQTMDWNWTNLSQAGNKFEYCSDNKWLTSDISSDGVFTGLPSGYKGYIRIDLSTLNYRVPFNSENGYIFNSIELKFNAFGGENGAAILGGLFYFPETKSESTVLQVDGLYYNLSKSSEAIAVNTYDVKSENGSSFSTRYTGTAGKVTVKYADNVETSAFWGVSPVSITSKSGVAETTTGYMNTYINSKSEILVRPGVDTVMFYVEMPEFNQSNTAPSLKLLDSELKQADKTATLSFSNSLYQYADIIAASWKIARAGADGDLFDIPSGFRGYIKFNIKEFKNLNDVKKVIDFSKQYYMTKFEIGFNHIGGENGNLIIGGVYSVIDDSVAPYIKNVITSDKHCFKVIPGDFDCDGTYDTDDMVLIRKSLLGVECELEPSAKLRENNIDIRTLVHAKKVGVGIAEADTSVNYNNGVISKNIFTDDYKTDKTLKYYEPHLITDDECAAKIEANTALNSTENSINFANEINSSKIGDFEKNGIDKMCHVSTFLYANDNIYVSYYANTISAAENPQYQVARFAYAPENNTDAKVILDIMQVGDDLYGYKVTGVYDTILMQKKNEPNNIYILWTASINQKYYRLYRIFNTETKQLGEIGVNRFKVRNITNDFSSTGIQKALAANDIGCKGFFSDIGIMQKLSTRVENGETYYYTGAYSGNFTCIIKSKDLIIWEYVAQPDEGANGTGFKNATKWENAVYVLGDKVYYFVRQWAPYTGEKYASEYGILTYYDLSNEEWAKPVLVGDSQSRSDFIFYKNNLYLFYAPTDRNHIGILKINTENIAKSEIVLQANMNGSCFYPFVQYNSKGELCMSYTIDRKHIRLASFTLSKYIN